MVFPYKAETKRGWKPSELNAMITSPFEKPCGEGIKGIKRHLDIICVCSVGVTVLKMNHSAKTQPIGTVLYDKMWLL